MRSPPRSRLPVRIARIALTALTLGMGATNGAQAQTEPKAQPTAFPAPRPVASHAVAQGSWSTWPAVASRAVQLAVDGWTGAASLNGVVVNSVIAEGGRVAGPPLAPAILSTMVGGSVPGDIAQAFALAISSAWVQWASSLTVPALPLYPTFGAAPGPLAPPMANVPVALSALSGNAAPLSAANLTLTLRTALGSHLGESGAGAAIDVFARTTASRFAAYRAACMVTSLIGSGPVPTFGPTAPLGPVVGGTANMPPGGLKGAWPAS